MKRRWRLWDFLKRTLADPVAAFTAVIAALTFAYFLVSAFQLRALYQSNEGAQRAWVLIAPIAVPATLRLDPEAGKPFSIDTEAENTGKSPAQKIRIDNVAWVGPIGHVMPDEKAIYQKPRQPPSVGILGSAHRLVIPFPDVVLTQPQIDAIKSGTHALYFVGRITYSDGFRDGRRTRFCFYWVPGLKPGQVSVCQFYNEAE